MHSCFACVESRISTYSRRFFVSGLLSSTACHRSLKHFPFEPSNEEGEGLEVTYFGVGCLKFRFGSRSILTDPFFSYLPFAQVAFGSISSDPTQYEPYLSDVKGVDVVLVGHSHYDHVLDLPVVAPELAPHAQILGSQTLYHTFAASNLPRPILSVQPFLATPNRHGEWVHMPGQHIRILPIRSDHPTQYLFIHLFTDHVTSNREAPLRKASDYQEGETIAYLVDFLDPSTGSIQCRVYVQTSSTGYPAGYCPKDIVDEHPITLAVLGMDCANIKAQKKTSIIDFLQPKAVIFCHWEDFFRPKTKEPREIVRVDLHKLRKALPSTEKRRYIFPYWDRRYIVPVVSSG